MIGCREESMNGPHPAPTVVATVGDSLTSPLREALLEGVATELRCLEPAGAIEALKEPDVGCLLADHLLRGTTGIDLCRDIRERDAAFPVVFYADDTDGLSRELINAGANGYYTPADSLETVRRAVDEALKGYSRHQEGRIERSALGALLDDGEPNVYVKDGEGRYLRAAPTHRIVDPEDAIGRTDADIYGETDPETARRAVADDRRVVETGEAIRGRDERYGGGSTAHVVRTTKIPWRDGERAGLVGVSVDVTDLKRKERELEELRERFESFAGNVRTTWRTRSRSPPATSNSPRRPATRTPFRASGRPSIGSRRYWGTSRRSLPGPRAVPTADRGRSPALSRTSGAPTPGRQSWKTSSPRRRERPSARRRYGRSSRICSRTP